MNPQNKPRAAAAALLALTACLTILALAVPSLAQDRPSSPTAPQLPIYVDQDATGLADGTSWADAYTTVQDAIAVAEGDQIWVAEGVYYPDEGVNEIDGDRLSTFQLEQGVALYGGFAGTETELEQRDWVANVTVLSGDLSKNDTVDLNGVVVAPGNIEGTDNAYHVVTADDVSLSAEVDGFVITAGLADSLVIPEHTRGAGILTTDASPTLANLIVRGNKAITDGGGMFNENGNPSFTNVTIRDNYAQNNGGGLADTRNASGRVENVTFYDNEAGANGGGMHLTATAAQTLATLTFFGNLADAFGGGLYAQASILSTLDGTSFTENTADRGGGLYLDSSVFDLDSVTFTDNAALDQGGGIFAQLGDYSLTRVTFSSNDAFAAGGGLYSFSNIIAVNASSFTANTSVLGAGMHVDDQELEAPALTVSGTMFVANVASEDGGGLYAVDSLEGALSDVSFIANQATGGDGGGMFLINSGPYALARTVFESNTAISGGGMYVEASNPELIASTFTGNRAQLTYVDDTLGGGGIYLASSSDATFSRTTFSGNSAATGGGMYISDSKPTLTNVAFTGNQAGDGIAGSGGGLWNTLGSPILTDVLFGGNAATLNGGGMCTGGAGSNPVLTNLTFSGNAAGVNGGGLYTTSPNVTVHNTVIWNNKDISGVGTANASLWDSPDAVIDHSLIQGQTPTGLGNLDGTLAANDPLFVVPVDPNTAPSTAGILSVKFGSPIVDVGDNTVIPPGVTLDLADNPRIYNGTVDLGAYELPLACPPALTTRLYVDHTATLGDTGVSWLDALKNLRDAFTLADNCPGIVDIWVAKGAYRPDEGVGMVPNSRTETYQLVDGVAVYGGFEGDESTLAERDWLGNVTILSGDVDSNDIATNGIVLSPYNIRGANSYHVVIAGGVADTTILDGFTITAGQANGAAPADHGAGFYNDAGSPTLANLTFIGNSATYGGGMANLNSSFPVLTNVTFKSNAATSQGGALFNYTSNPELTYAILSGNTASSGAAIFNDSANPTLVNALLSGNYASANGGAFYNWASHPHLINVTVAGNRAYGLGGGIYNITTSQPDLRNSIIWGNQDSTGAGTASATIHNADEGSVPAINYTLVQALSGITYTGADNLSANPWFTAPLAPSSAPTTGGTYTLGIFSPAIDAGDTAANTTLTDLAGGVRVINFIIDLGPYEAPYVPIYDVYLPIVLRYYP